MKKLFLVGLALTLTLALFLTGCGQVVSEVSRPNAEEETQSASTPEATEPKSQLQQLIDNKEYQQAYDLLLAIENPTEEEKQLLAGFRFQLISDSNTTYTYSEDGLLLATDTLDELQVWEGVTYTYDDHGRVLTETTATASGQTVVTYTYDDQGRTLSEVSVDPYGKQSTLNYSYNEQGLLAILELVDSYKEVYSYDQQGNLISLYITGNRGYWYRTEYVYNELGQLTAESTTNSYEEYDHTTYTYNEQGDPLEIIYSTTSYKKTIAHTYNDQGLLASKKHTSSDGSIDNTTTFSYDQQGNLIEEYTESKYSWYKDTYTYDSYGNMLTSERKESEGFGYIMEYTWKLFYNPLFAEEAES